MITKSSFTSVALALLALLNLNTQLSTLLAQGTAFTYQGRLNDDGNPANGRYDFQFSLSNAPSGGSQVGSTLTDPGVGVTDGLFTVTLDFGANFPGASRWLAIGLRTNGGDAFTALSPLLELTPTPYAIYTSSAGSATTATTATTAASADSVAAANVTGILGFEQLPAEVVTNEESGVTLGGIFDGDGAGLTDLNASQLLLGTVPSSVLSSFQAPGYNSIGGGEGNVANGGNATVGGGYYNSAGGVFNTVAGGYKNNASGPNDTIGGGVNNIASDQGSTVAGGSVNTASGSGSFVGGGGFDGSSFSGNTASGGATTVAGGWGNSAVSTYDTVGGGEGNEANGGNATVGGGYYNSAGGFFNTVAGGYKNNASGPNDTIGGGVSNLASSQGSTVAGGSGNTASGPGSFVGGGGFDGGSFSGNTAFGGAATVAGGFGNVAQNTYATVCGGYSNNAAGVFSFAAGNQAEALYQGDFVWADSQASPFNATGSDQFDVRSQGGVDFEATGGILMNVSGSSGLHPAALKLDSTSGNGVGLYVVEGSSDAATVIANTGTGDIIKGFSGASGGNLVFEVLNSGTVLVNGVALTSDRNAKENFTALDNQAVLAKVASLPVTEWNYKVDHQSVRHIGPMAQDFQAAFGLDGGDDKHISVVDEGGVALAAIQGLNQKLEATQQAVKAKDAEIRALQQTVAQLKTMVQSLATQK